MVQYARVERKSAPLSSEFSREFVERRFGGKESADLIYSLLPVYSRGPRKGTVKGFIHWQKVTVGGWHHDRVLIPGTHNVYISLSFEAIDHGGFFERSHHPSELPADGEQSWSARIHRAMTEIINRAKSHDYSRRYA